MISWNLKTRTYQPIGLDIGYHSIKMIQLAIEKDRVCVIAADKVHIDPEIIDDDKEREKFTVTAIEQMLQRNSFQGSDIVFALPNDKLKITSIRVARANSEDIEQVMKKEASKRFGLNSDDDVINYMFAGNVQNSGELKGEWILLAVDGETVRNYIGMLERLQLKPVAIDAIPCALFRSFKKLHKQQQDQERTELLVDVGSRSTTIVFGRGGSIGFIKQIPIGGRKFNQEVAQKLGIDVKKAEALRATLRNEKLSKVEQQLPAPRPNARVKSSIDASTRQIMVDAISSVAEQLAKEISMCLKYYTVTFRGKRMEQLVLSGGEAYENILANIFKRQLTMDIELAQPLKSCDMTNTNLDNENSESLSEWALAVGLSLKD